MKNLEKYSRDRGIAIWLMAGVLMIIIQIILGGITRLTDSGLSITEWKPILGSIPPMNEAQWTSAFEKYKGIAQYKHLHYYFTLQDFKSIFFWEWLHRNWGRLMGLVFLVPFLIFLQQKRFKPSMVRPMIILFLLGGLQGAIGWLMVESGLNEEDLYVSHIRLSIHFVTALVLLVYVFWFALQLLTLPRQRTDFKTARKFSRLIIGILCLQLFYGAFMAGLKAAVTAPTWPDINGTYFPENTSSFGGKSYSFISSLVNQPLMVQFIHRNLAYLIFFLVVAWTIIATRRKTGSSFDQAKWFPLILVSLQVVLGIAAVLTSPDKVPQKWGLFESNALIHQFVALLLLLSLVLVLFLSSQKQKLNQE